MAGIPNFNLTPEQQEKFNLIFEETKKVHPELIVDEISEQRIKVLIAYTVINGDFPLNKKEEQGDEFYSRVKE